MDDAQTKHRWQSMLVTCTSIYHMQTGVAAGNEALSEGLAARAQVKAHTVHLQCKIGVDETCRRGSRLTTRHWARTWRPGRRSWTRRPSRRCTGANLCWFTDRNAEGQAQC